MSLRPVAARWFEVIVPVGQCAQALEALAGTGAVQVETREGRGESLRLDVLRSRLQDFHALDQRFGGYWPAPVYRRGLEAADSLEDTLARAMSALEAWVGDAQRDVNALQEQSDALAEAVFWRKALSAAQTQGVDPELLLAGGRLLEVTCCCPEAGTALPLFGDVAGVPLLLDDLECTLALVPRSQVEVYRRQMHAHQAHCHTPPDWLRGSDGPEHALNRREEAAQSEMRRLQAALQQVNAVHRLAERLGDVRRIEWMTRHIAALEGSRHFAWITGWTSAADPDALHEALHQAKVSSVVHLPALPEGTEPPLLLRHGGWVRPFEVFVRALGMPGRFEVDPSVILAGVVPLMFGYMFGDVGHGAVLLVLGLLLRRRYELASILLPCGVSAMLFGVLFGSIFSQEHVFPPLWVNPLTAPLEILALPLLGGVFLLALGIVLNGVEARWRSRVGIGWLADGGFLIAYLGLVAGFVDARGFYLVPIGVLLYLLVHALQPGRRIVATLSAVGHLVETGLQILINTLSFLRVGAFALAHAGLSSAVVALSQTAGGLFGEWTVLIVGNVLILAIEGLVVSIQTTRLVLFEFFVRFLNGTGRPFAPLPYPPSVVQGERVHERENAR
ncbi:V-type ATPase 116kDa subunit family protein [Acidihalobacter prosperus]